MTIYILTIEMSHLKVSRPFFILHGIFSYLYLYTSVYNFSFACLFFFSVTAASVSSVSSVLIQGSTENIPNNQEARSNSLPIEGPSGKLFMNLEVLSTFIDKNLPHAISSFIIAP